MSNEYVTLTEAARRLGLSEPAMRRRVDRGALATYTNPVDLRSKLLRVSDLEAYAVPQPVTPAGWDRGGGEVAMSG